MQTEKILYGRKPDYESWQEDIITERADRIEAAKAWAVEQGYTEFRVLEFTPGDMPDFAGTVKA